MRSIAHPPAYKEGTRILVLRGRHKDGIATERGLTRVSHDAAQFDCVIDELSALLQPGERIYATAASRDVAKAVRLFKERQLAADYDRDPHAFYRALESRWASCLMAPSAQAHKLWLVDCDSKNDAVKARAALSQHYDKPFPVYEYPSKSGTHFIAEAFDTRPLGEDMRTLIHENALMLWAYA